jgi:hypothetical protein
MPVPKRTKRAVAGFARGLVAQQRETALLSTVTATSVRGADSGLLLAA